MTVRRITRLFAVTGLALLLTTAATLPLHATAWQSGGSRGVEGTALQATATTTISIQAPSPAETVTIPVATPTPTGALATPSSLPSSPLSTLPAPTDAPTIAPTAEAPTPTAVPTGIPELPATPSPADRAIALLSQHWPWAAAACLVSLLVLGLLLILWAFRRRRPGPLPRAPITAGPYLESVGIPGEPRRFDLDPDGFAIGRAPENDLVITQDFPTWDTVSRHHARIYRQADRWVVEDLGSMNGVYVEGRRTGRNLLRDGWRLSIGGAEFVFRAGTGEV
jgi:hypothetical protein